MPTAPPTALPMAIEWIEGIEALRPWAAQWRRLAQDAPQRLPMLSWDWVSAYAQALMPATAALHCVLAHRGGALLGALPLVVQRARGGSHWPLRLAAASTPYDSHAAFGDVLSDRVAAAQVVPTLLRAACAHPRLALREVAMRGVASGSPTLACLAQAQPGLKALISHRSWGSYLPLTVPWEAQRAGWSKNFRANIRKAHNRLHEAGAPRAEFTWLTGTQAQAHHIETFMTLEAAGWKGQAGSAIAQQQRLQHFYAELASLASEAGTLEWHFMRVGERPVAAHMALRCGRVLCLLKIAYDESHASFSPGNLLFEATAARASARGDTDEINCLTDMPWHRPWNMARREYFDARLYPATLLGYSLGWAPRLLITGLKAVRARATAARPLYAKLGPDRPE